MGYTWPLIVVCLPIGNPGLGKPWIRRVSPRMGVPNSRSSVDEGQPRSEVACHVISAGYAPGSDEWNVECATLDPAILKLLREASHPSQGQAAMARHVLAAARENNLPGVAIIWNATPYPPLPEHLLASASLYLAPPPAWTVLFEPAELDETDPTILMICDMDPIRQVQTARSERVSPFHPARWGVSYLLATLLAVLMMLCSCCFLPPLVALRGPGLLALLLIIVCLVYVVFRRIVLGASEKWLLVPRGVVIRREPALSRKSELRLFTPADTLLMLTPEPPGWRATLNDGSRRFSRIWTRIEATALLRAWQSPCSPPHVDRLVDMA
ncbi:MAG: hypothetical protein GX616_13875 [Planctomycetes bacterium]|nr:hypothetical protein [Planctomycetota bacterium]